MILMLLVLLFFMLLALWRHSPLTLGERKLLQAAAMGLENKQIATEQGLSLGTVKNGLTRIFGKLGLESRVQAALYYWGLWHLLKPHPSRSENPNQSYFSP